MILRTRVGLLAVALTACGGRPLEPREPSRGADHLTVATFNVYHPSWNDEETVEAVGRTGADVVCLQEVTANWERVLRARYAEAYAFMLFKADRASRGLAVLSRYPLTDRGLLRAPHDWHPGWRFYVHAPFADIQVMHIHLRALSTGPGTLIENYLSTPDDHEWEIRTFAAHGDGRPTLFIGDFNEGGSGAAVEWLERRGFVDVLPLYRPGQPTWRGRSMARQLELTVDHILFDASFEPLDAWILPTGNSDHYPVVARLELKNRSPNHH